MLETGRRISKRYLAERVSERRFRGLFHCERSLVREMEAFVAGPSATSPRLEASGWDGCRVTEMIDAVYRSSSSLGEKITLERPSAHHAVGDRLGLGSASPRSRGDEWERAADPDVSRVRLLGPDHRDRPRLVRRDALGARRRGFPRGGPRELGRPGRPPVERGFALTIDDGLQSIFRVADVLARYEVVATVFLVTDRVGADNDWPGQPAAVVREPLLSWSDLDALESIGVRFAAHGRTHVRLDRCSEAQLDDELQGSRDDVEQRLGRPCPLFAYPYGRSDARVRRAARRHFAAAFGTRLDTADVGEDLHYIPGSTPIISDRGERSTA